MATATAALAAVLLAGVARAQAGDGPSATGATIDKLGWWHARNTATSTPAANVTVPPPPGVPAGTLSVGAVNGEPDRISAIGILPDAGPGDTITSFSLTVKEAGPPAAGVNGAAARIVACPITEFWVAVENGTWDSRPIFDCTIASAPGTRADDGTWTFDLLPIGQAWTDPAGTITADGVVLVEDVAAPESFETVLATSGEGAIVVSLAFEPGAPTTDDALLEDGGALADGSGGLDAASGFDVPAFGDGGLAVDGLPSPGAATPVAGTAPSLPPAGAARTIAHTSPNVLGNLPGGLVLAAPAFLALLALLAYSLGPAGEPVAVTRQRGVSRALAARARSGTPTPPEPTSLEST